MRPANISKQRIMGEAKKLAQQKLPYLRAQPLPDDIYTWHFTIQGPEGTQFHQGIYHGQILLPYEYPFKPPDIVFMNKNGRFETNTKICLTITQYHPQEWNSAWTIRTMLEAVISLFAQNIQGVGALTSSHDIRAFLAVNSHSYHCEKCGPIAKHLAPRAKREQEEKVPTGMERTVSLNPPAAVKVEAVVKEEKQEQVPQTVPRNMSQNLNPVVPPNPPQPPQIHNHHPQYSTFTNPSHHRLPPQQHAPSGGVERIIITETNPHMHSWKGFRHINQSFHRNLADMEAVMASIRWE